MVIERLVLPATGTPRWYRKRAHSSALRGPVSVRVLPVSSVAVTMSLPITLYLLVPSGQLGVALPVGLPQLQLTPLPLHCAA